MNYLSAKQLAKKWGVSERRITALCKEGLLPGAKKAPEGIHNIGVWRIPVNVQKPDDKRLTQNGLYCKYKETKSLINNVHRCDCLIKMTEIKDASIDFILCDLPYNNNGNWRSFISLKRLWAEYKRIIKPNGVIALFTAQAFTADIISSNRDWFKYKWVWIKSHATSPQISKRMPMRKHEDICIFYPPKAKPIFNYETLLHANGNYVTDTIDIPHDLFETDDHLIPKYNILEFESVSDAKDELCINRFHTMQKPLALMRFLVLAYTNPGDLVLDNTCGAGSAITAALIEGRNFIGIENDMEYFKSNYVRSLVKTCENNLSTAWCFLNLETRASLYPSELFERFNKLERSLVFNASMRENLDSLIELVWEKHLENPDSIPMNEEALSNKEGFDDFIIYVKNNLLIKMNNKSFEKYKTPEFNPILQECLDSIIDFIWTKYQESPSSMPVYETELKKSEAWYDIIKYIIEGFLINIQNNKLDYFLSNRIPISGTYENYGSTGIMSTYVLDSGSITLTDYNVVPQKEYIGKYKVLRKFPKLTSIQASFPVQEGIMKGNITKINLSIYNKHLLTNDDIKYKRKK